MRTSPVYRVVVDGRPSYDRHAKYADAMREALTHDATHEVHLERELPASGGVFRWYCEGHHYPGVGWDFGTNIPPADLRLDPEDRLERDILAVHSVV